MKLYLTTLLPGALLGGITPGSIVTVKIKATTIMNTIDPVASWYQVGSPRMLNKYCWFTLSRDQRTLYQTQLQ